MTAKKKSRTAATPPTPRSAKVAKSNNDTIIDLTFSTLDPDPVGTAISARGSTQFHDALGLVADKSVDVKTEKLPRELRMIRVLLFLEFYKDNFEYFLFNLERGFAPQVPEAKEFCREIGATGAANLLTRLAKLFPEGMPRTYREFMAASVARDLDKSLDRIQRETKSFSRELFSALRQWLKAHGDDVNRALDSAKDVPAKPAGVRAKRGSKAAARKTDAAQSSPLDEALAVTDPDPMQAGFDFLNALRDWVWSVPGRKQIPFDSLPETARMIVLLNELVSAFNSSGLLYLADWDVGDHFVDLRRWSAQVGAERTGEYLDGFAALFSRRSVPKDRDKRSAALERVVGRANTKGVDPLDLLDDEFRESALMEIPQRMREWVVRHRAVVEAELTQMAAQPSGASGNDLLLAEQDFLAGLAELQSNARGRKEDAWLLVSPAAVGDVIALKTRKGYAYLQVTHEHPYVDVAGPVMRVVEGLTKESLTGDALAAHVTGPTRHYRLIWLSRWLVEDPKRLKIVARGLPVPDDAHAFPPFLFASGRTRDGRAVFGQWDGGKRPSQHLIAPLTEAQLRMSAASSIVDVEWLAGEIADSRWTPAREHMDSY